MGTAAPGALTKNTFIADYFIENENAFIFLGSIYITKGCKINIQLFGYGPYFFTSFRLVLKLGINF